MRASRSAPVIIRVFRRTASARHIVSYTLRSVAVAKKLNEIFGLPLDPVTTFATSTGGSKEALATVPTVQKSVHTAIGEFLD